MIDVLFDKNVVSKVPPYVRMDSGRPIESFAITLYRAMVGDSSPTGNYRDGNYVVNPLRSIPVDDESSVLIPFFREPKEYPAYSLSDVLAGKYPKDAFRGKAVLVGEYGTLIHDSHFSPVNLGVAMPGIEFHANLLDGLITGKFLRHFSDVENIVLVAVVALLSVAVFMYASVVVSVAYAGGFLVVSLLVGWYSMAAYGIVPSYFLLSLAGAFITFPAAYAYRYFVVDRDRHYIEKAFARYVDPEIVEAISDDPKSLHLGGQKRDITVFFSDIAGFTTISESLGTERLFALISEYLSQMTDILIRNRGTLDKYIGDAVMGFFGAPLPMEKPEAAACRTALEQQARLRMLRTQWKKEGIPTVSARIGIHAGEAMVGNVGSKTRFNYTVMGDTVNLASRLEGVNKEYGTLICVSETVAERAKDEFVFRELDTIKVKGKTEGVRIFELMGFADDPYVDRKKIARYEEALTAYRDGRFSEAKKLFDVNLSDLPSIMMSFRCESLIKGETTLENGTYSMKTK
ncbi:MAG: Adenylate/guanylate cyclase protein [Patescibacteria group bacterium]|nr:Adenylate/guanylate cyclase protein [Patescibacteria group bacterium]